MFYVVPTEGTPPPPLPSLPPPHTPSINLLIGHPETKPNHIHTTSDYTAANTFDF